MNEAMLDLLNGQIAGRLSLLDAALKWSSADAIFVLVAVAGAFGLVQLRRTPGDGLRTAGAVILAAAIAGLAISVLSSAVHEDRPFLHDADTVQLVAHAADNGFPSDHATVAAVVAVVAAAAWRRWAPLFLALALLVGFSRVAVGVHYPGDVLAGWAIGAAAALAAWIVMPVLTRRIGLGASLSAPD